MSHSNLFYQIFRYISIVKNSWSVFIYIFITQNGCIRQSLHHAGQYLKTLHSNITNCSHLTNDNEIVTSQLYDFKQVSL